MTQENYPCKILDREINEKNVSIIGVQHTLEFYDQYKDFFKSVIKENDAFIFEQPYNGDFWNGITFFSMLGKIAHNQKKKIYQPDPNNLSLTTIDTLSSFAGAFFILGGLIGPNFRDYIGHLINPDFNERKTSRRNFFKRAAITGAGASIFLGSMPGFITRYFIDEDKSYSYGLDDVLTYGNYDYRNIKIAEGIEKICENAGDIKNLAVIHGALHTELIAAYLDSKNLRLKKLAYLPYEAIGKTKVREYIPKENTPSNKDEWELVREF